MATTKPVQARPLSLTTLEQRQSKGTPPRIPISQAKLAESKTFFLRISGTSRRRARGHLRRRGVSLVRILEELPHRHQLKPAFAQPLHNPRQRLRGVKRQVV